MHFWNQAAQESLKTGKINYFPFLKPVILYIRDYFRQVNKQVLLLLSVFIAVLIFINYHYGLDGLIRKNSFGIKLIAWYAVFAVAFIIPYALTALYNRNNYIRQPLFIVLALIAPLIFSLKLTLGVPFHFSAEYNWDNYWNHIVYWPSLVIIITILLFVMWRIFDREQPFYGLTAKDINWKPYWIMLLIMLPLIALASTQPDFLAVYPKLKSIQGIFNDNRTTIWHKLLFELSYGTDFITIELFFRGFLVLAFVKWAGKNAILPMACFYCTIHFGKPLGECISSYFGGIILGIVVYNTRSIYGGLMVHLGIAWLMELGGYVSDALRGV